LQYFSVLRCRAYFDWPEHCKFTGGEFTVPVQRGTATIDVTAQLIIATYEARRKADTSPPVDGQSFGPRVWRGKINAGYGLGDYVVKSPEEELEIAFEYDDAQPGELDIIVTIDSQANIHESVVRDIAAPISYRLISYINFSSGDIIVPTAPFQIFRVLGPSKFQLESSFMMSVRQHRSIEVQEASLTIHRFLQRRSGMQADEVAYLDVACRRFITAIQETDPIDKFCDFWEACEFLSENVRGKGLKHIASRVAKALSDHTKKSKANLDKVIVQPLYSIRIDIVHNAIENFEKVDRNLLLLEEVARELIKSKLGLSYTGSLYIDSTLNPSSTKP
jgi:hypothetical protein